MAMDVANFVVRNATKTVGAIMQQGLGWSASELRDLLIANDPRVKQVRLTCTAHFSKEDWKKVLEALRGNTSCERLVVSNCALGDADAELIAAALEAPSSMLKAVLVSYNPDITDAGGVRLAKAIGASKVLEYVELNSTSVGDSTAKALARHLLNNTSLQELLVGDTNITEAGASALREAAARNSTLRRIDMEFHLGLVKGVGNRRVSAAARDQVYAAVEAPVTSLEASKFGQTYATAVHCDTCSDLQALVQDIVEEYVNYSDVFVSPTALDDFNKALLMEMKDKFSRGLSDADQQAAVAWTSAQELTCARGGRHRIYGIIQKVLRDDCPGALMQKVANYCRTFNRLIVTREQRLRWHYKDGERWVAFHVIDDCLLEEKRLAGETRVHIQPKAAAGTPYKIDLAAATRTDEATGRIDSIERRNFVPEFPATTSRGAWIPKREVEHFFQPGRKYRYPGYLASSTASGIAESFLKHGALAGCEEAVPVKFVFHFDQVRGCVHVNFLEEITLVPGEQEWLFQHYSTFVVQDPQPPPVNAGPYSPANPMLIHLDVSPDSRLEPLDVPLAAWH